MAGACRWLETDTTTDHDLSSAHVVGTYTADADRLIIPQVFLDTVAGNGDYIFYATLQIAGAGSFYVVIPKTTAAAASGETAIAAQGNMVAVRNLDVLTIYVDCLAGDISVDAYCRFFEVAALQPTTPDLTLDVAATGEAGLDFTNRLDTTGILPNIVAGGAGGLFIAGTNAQTKIVANVASQGALDIRNSNAAGYGLFNLGGETGLYNMASQVGSKGQVNQGIAVGQYNYGDIGAENQGIATYGLENNGVSEGQYNLASAAGSSGLRNQGVGIGELNNATGVGSTGQKNQGLSEGQYNNATGAGGVGQKDIGITYGIQSTGGTDGINAVGTANVGLLANGAIAGQYNLGNGGAGYGQYNSGDIIGQYNAASAAGSAGQANQGVAQGQHNSGATGQQNDGGAVGQYNTGTTYGSQNTGASGQVNVGTAGDGIYASGTDYGIQAVGVTGDIDPDLSPLLTGVNVTSIGNSVITAASIATDAIDADALATDAADEIADHVWDEAIGGHLGVGSTGAALNAVGGGATVFPAGAIEFTYTVTDSVTGLPLEGVEVWISTDNPAVNIVWKGDTDAFGIAMDVLGNKPKLDAGTYYFWRQLAGYLFTDPDTEVVS